MKTMGDSHNLDLKSDVLLLADVFEKFINVCIEYYGLDLVTISAVLNVWDAALKVIRVKLELISDIDTYLFVEKGMKGGISYTTTRYSKANNKYMKSYDDSKPSKYITYLDVNNFCGCAMS